MTVLIPRSLSPSAERLMCFTLDCIRLCDLHYSSRNHLKDIPEAVSESQHVTYSHREWRDSMWEARGATREAISLSHAHFTVMIVSGLVQTETPIDHSSNPRQVFAFPRVPREKPGSSAEEAQANLR